MRRPSTVLLRRCCFGRFAPPPAFGRWPPALWKRNRRSQPVAVNNPPRPNGQIDSVVARGQKLENEHRWGEAVTLYEEALRENPADHDSGHAARAGQDPLRSRPPLPRFQLPPLARHARPARSPGPVRRSAARKSNRTTSPSPTGPHWSAAAPPAWKWRWAKPAFAKQDRPDCRPARNRRLPPATGARRCKASRSAQPPAGRSTRSATAVAARPAAIALAAGRRHFGIRLRRRRQPRRILGLSDRRPTERRLFADRGQLRRPGHRAESPGQAPC